MLKKKNAKKQMKYLMDNGVKIKCMFCDIKNNCKTRVNKEKSEALGIITYCTLTPNRPKKRKKKQYKK